LSNELTYAISQILAQKANWEIEGVSDNYTSKGERITEGAYDVNCILIIGDSHQFAGEDRQSVTKKKTVELYRRNLKNIEIVLFDELFERARFIVSHVDDDGDCE
jgi:hypothetical protein